MSSIEKSSRLRARTMTPQEVDDAIRAQLKEKDFSGFAVVNPRNDEYVRAKTVAECLAIAGARWGESNRSQWRTLEIRKEAVKPARSGGRIGRMTKLLREVFADIRTLPAEEQDRAAHVLQAFMCQRQEGDEM